MATQDHEGEANQYQELFNDDNPLLNVLEGEAEYGFFHESEANIMNNDSDAKNDPNQPLINNDNKNVFIDKELSNNELYEEEGMIDELKIIYNKLGLSSSFVTLLCIIALIIGIANEFYNWNGILFNILVLCGGIVGMQCGYYYDFKYNTKKQMLKKYQIRKLKTLLIYFMICIFFTMIVLGIEIVYLFLIPHRKQNEYSTSVMVGCIIFYIFGILFWMVFVSFYIDLTARAVLKRGRIDFVIIHLKNDINSSNIWIRLYFFVIKFRIKFRSVRRMLTMLTGIYCFKGRIKRAAVNPGKVHEEQKVIAMLNENNAENEQCCTVCNNVECDLKGYVSNLGSCILFYICCPCVVFSKIFPKINPMYVISTMVFAYIFAPIFLLGCMVLILMSPVIISQMAEGNKVGCCGVSFLFVLPLWIYIWWGLICPNTATNVSRGWDWNAQCVMWNYTTLIFVEIVIRALIESSD